MSKEEEVAKGMVNEWQDDVHNDLKKAIDKIISLEQGQINLDHKIKFAVDGLMADVKDIFSQNMKIIHLLNERIDLLEKKVRSKS